MREERVLQGFDCMLIWKESTFQAMAIAKAMLLTKVARVNLWIIVFLVY